MSKTELHIKEPITLRQKKLKNGRISLYLDTYVSYSGKAGKNHSHSYEFLKLYLVPEITKEDKRKNAEILKAALAIKNQKLIDRANNKANLSQTKKMKLSEWMESYAALKLKEGRSNSRAKMVMQVLRHLNAYRGSNVALEQVDKKFCIGFVYYLSTVVAMAAQGKKTKKGKPKLEKTSAHVYFDVFKSALNEAMRQGYIYVNPCTLLSRSELKPISGGGKEIHYLSVDEIRALVAAHCPNDAVKKAFLFACFCGLRVSDVRDLVWRDIQVVDGVMYIRKLIIKTHERLGVPLSKKAVEWLPERGAAAQDSPVFDLPSSANGIRYSLRIWGKNAELSFGLHFHVSRHTFATSLLTAGADLYTTSKLLGHHSLAVTQIYADVIDKKKQDAVSLLDSLDLGNDEK